MTNQEALTKVVLHSRAQGERAVDESGKCQFLTLDGKRCFLGCLMSEREANSATDLGEGELDVAHELGLEDDFAIALVKVHDNSAPRNWEAALGYVAKQWGLEMPV